MIWYLTVILYIAGGITPSANKIFIENFLKLLCNPGDSFSNTLKRLMCKYLYKKNTDSHLQWP